MSTAKTEAVIRINGGQDVPLTAQQILSITVSKEVNKIPMAVITMKDGQVNEQDFKISNQDFFKPGVPIEILIGEPQRKATIFKGVITQHGLKIKKDKPSVLVIECKDEAVRLSIGRKSRYWNDKPDSDIFKEIIGEYTQLQVETEVINPAIQHNQIIQYYSTDWDFLALRSEAIGQYLFVDNGKLSIKKPKLSDQPKFALTYGAAGDTPERSRIWEFESEMDARYQYKEINTITWDYSKQEVVQGANNFSAPTEPGNINSQELAGVIGLSDYDLHHHARMNENELNAFANAIKQKSILNKIRGRVKFDGRADVKPGDMITLEGVGNRFNGNVFVARVHHEFEPGRWFTNIQFGMPYTWFHEEKNISNTSALGLLPLVEGLQIGKVIQLKDNSNPDKDFRIKVEIPGLHKKNEGVWARLATLHAGNQRGTVFLPEIGDEVIVGYIGQDTREPVILGSLFSENVVPPLKNDDHNYKKGIITKNQHKIIIDEENNIITIETQGKNQFALDDSAGKIELVDKNNNKVTLDNTGITFDSIKDVIIKAPGNFKVSATSKVILNGIGGVEVNHPTGGEVKLGAGILPAARQLDQISPPVPQPQVIAVTSNFQVKI